MIELMARSKFGHHPRCLGYLDSPQSVCFRQHFPFSDWCYVTSFRVEVLEFGWLGLGLEVCLISLPL